MPGVTGASYTTLLPFDRDNFSEGLFREGVTPTSGGEEFVLYQSTDPGYVELLGLPLLAGRHVTPADREGAPRVA